MANTITITRKMSFEVGDVVEQTFSTTLEDDYLVTYLEAVKAALLAFGFSPELVDDYLGEV